MSKRRWAVWRSIASSSTVSRSISTVAKPACCSEAATARLRGLCRLLPLPWANTTAPRHGSGRARSPSSATSRSSMGIWIGRVFTDGRPGMVLAPHGARPTARRRSMLSPSSTRSVLRVATSSCGPCIAKHDDAATRRPDAGSGGPRCPHEPATGRMGRPGGARPGATSWVTAPRRPGRGGRPERWTRSRSPPNREFDGPGAGVDAGWSGC